MASDRDLPLFLLLDASFFMRARIRAVPEGAQLLYMRSLGLAKLLISDGRIEASQLDLISLRSESDQSEAIGELLRVGLWIESDGGYEIDGWERWNASRDEISEKRRRASAIGNHKKWKHAEKPSAECVICREDGLIPTDSESESQTDRKRSRKNSLETELKEEVETKNSSGSSPPAPKPFEVDFAALYDDIWRKHEDRARSLREYQTRRRDGVDHDTLVRAARGYIAATKDREPKLTKSLAVFLHGPDGPWSEYLESEQPVAAAKRCSECLCVGDHAPDCSRKEI